MRQDAAARQAPRAPRFWIAFGWAAHGLFAVTVYYLFFFLKGPDAPPAATSPRAAPIDGLLALQFAVFHSALLLPSVRARLTRFIPSPAYGVFFCFSTCVSLLTAIACWQPWGGAVWNLTGPAGALVEAAFYASWAAMFYSLYYSGFGYQTGWTTWRPWSQGRKVPLREFRPRGPFSFLRHPVYFSFLGLIWFTPCMTLDRVVLTAVWTIYIFYGSYLKDRRLLHYVGDRYRMYQSQVPGYPGLPFGPLSRVPWSPTTESSGIAN
jgi:protein-S-isoprenylcysteine O-methyltransferase Ste14